MDKCQIDFYIISDIKMEDDLEQNEAVAFSALMSLDIARINTDNGIILQKYIKSKQLAEYLHSGHIVIKTDTFPNFGVVYYRNKSYVTFTNNIGLVRSIETGKTIKKLFISPLFVDVSDVIVDIDVLMECYEIINNLFSILIEIEMKIFSSRIVETKIGQIYISMKYTNDGILMFESRISGKKYTKFIDFCNAL